MKTRLLLCILFFSFGTAFAQKDLQPGYILVNSDTIRGFIDAQSAIKSALSVSFTKSPEGETTIYSPRKIQGYGFERGSKFEAKKLIWSDSIQHLFLNVVVKGTASLYTHRDLRAKDHYYLIKGDTLQELILQKVKKTTPALGETEVIDYVFRRTLAGAFKACPAVQPKLNRLLLKRRDLTRVFVEYNSCVNPSESVFVQQQEKSKVTLGVIGGGSTSSFFLQKAPSTFMVGKIEANATYLVGLSLNMSLPAISKHLSFQTELLYTHHTYAETFYGPSSRYDVVLDVHYLKLPLMVGYSFRTTGIKPYMNAGFMNSFNLKGNNEYTHTFGLQGDERTTTAPVFPEGMRSYMLGLVAGAGVSLPIGSHRLNVEARFDSANGFTDNNSDLFSIKNRSFLVGFTF